MKSFVARFHVVITIFISGGRHCGDGMLGLPIRTTRIILM